jgi:hypothetical protein
MTAKKKATIDPSTVFNGAMGRNPPRKAEKTADIWYEFDRQDMVAYLYRDSRGESEPRRRR